MLTVSDNHIILGGGGGGGGATGAAGTDGVTGVVAGTGITVDNTDPSNPVISATGSVSKLLVARLSRESAVTIDITTKLMTGGGGLALTPSGYVSVAASQSVGFVAKMPTVDIITFFCVSSSGVLSVVGALETIPTNVYVFAVMYNQILYSLDDSKITVIGRTSTYSEFNSERMGMLMSTQTTPLITINQLTKLITSANDNSILITHRGGYRYITGNQSVDASAIFSGAATSGLYYLSVSPSGVLELTFAKLPSTKNILLLVIYGQTVYSLSDPRLIEYTKTTGKVGAVLGINPTAAVLSATPTLPLTVNLQDKTITVPTGALALTSGGTYVPITAGTYSFDMSTPTLLVWFYIPVAGGVVASASAPSPVPLGNLSLGCVFNKKLYGGLLGGTVIDNVGAVISSGTEVFNGLQTRLITPRDLYLIQDRPVHIFKKPLLAMDSADLIKSTDVIINTGKTCPDARIIPIDSVARVSSADLAATCTIGMFNKTEPDNRYLQTINVHSTASTAINGLAKNWQVIGDSLTEGGMIDAIQTKLAGFGSTITPVGTYSSAGTKSKVGEGRGYWTYRSFVGKDNYSVGVGAHTRSNGGKTTTTKFENPFLKLADATDKANHPDWCFRFTGSQSELSYTDDPDKTGNFYIFDYAWYLSSHTVAAPDVITIALSTNDINLDRDVYATEAQRTQYMRLGLDIMIRQIKSALPNVIIGVIPAPVWSDTGVYNTRYAAETTDWIEQCITDVTALKATFNNLYVVPVWMMMPEEWVFPYFLSIDTGALSTVKKSVIADKVHWAESSGLDFYTEAMLGFYAKAVTA